MRPAPACRHLLTLAGRRQQGVKGQVYEAAHCLSSLANARIGITKEDKDTPFPRMTLAAIRSDKNLAELTSQFDDTPTRSPSGIPSSLSGRAKLFCYLKSTSPHVTFIHRFNQNTFDILKPLYAWLSTFHEAQVLERSVYNTSFRTCVQRLLVGIF